MKPWAKVLSVLAFLAVCAGALAFLQRFTQSQPAFAYPAWETGAVVSAAGEERAFDPAGLPPELEEGERYRFGLTLPPGRENGVYLIFETAGLEAAAFLDGREIWYSAAAQDPETANQSQAHLPLPAGGGEALAMEVRPLSEGAILPPLLRLSADPTDQAGAIAYANYYGLPAGASALALVLLWGLFLLGLCHGKRDFPLLLPILAAALLTVHRLATGYGAYFLPQPARGLLALPWLDGVIALLLALYLALHRERGFWKGLGLIAAWSAGALAAAAAISRLRGGYLARYLAGLVSELGAGVWDGALYWLIWWLVLVCAALSAWDLARAMARSQGEARALALKNQLMQENYRAIEGRLRESARRGHEFSHQVTALDAAVQSRDWGEVERWVSVWKRGRGEDQPRFTGNATVNVILQDAAARAGAAGIAFEAEVMLPDALPIPDGDLCALLMNLLDNSLEGAARTPAGREKRVRFRMRVEKDFIPILCENTFDGHVETAPDGAIQTTKADAAAHGFGLAQMRAVAEKYDSILDVSWTEDRFTVQTAPPVPGGGIDPAEKGGAGRPLFLMLRYSAGVPRPFEIRNRTSGSWGAAAHRSAPRRRGRRA